MAREEWFLEALAELGGSAGNGKLQTEIGWQDATYARVQEALIEDGRIVKGRGRSVALAESAGQDEKAQPPWRSPGPPPGFCS